MKKYIIVILVVAIVAIVSLLAGRISLAELLGSSASDEFFNMIVFEIRLPRILAAFLIGASLSTAGVVFQGIFKNPLVGPDILGVSSGAGFGAVLCILFSASAWAVSAGAFAFGIISVSMTYFLGHLSNKNSKLMLVLSGVIVGAIFSALISIIKYVADPDDKLPSIVYWLLGSLNLVSWQDLVFLMPLSIMGVILLCALSWKINILSLSGEHTTFLGESGFVNILIIVIATLIVSASVAISGIIGWVGLLIPHISRMLFGSNNMTIVPISALIGGGYLMLIDTLARSVSSSEIPLSILTALVGAPLIGAIIIKKGKQWF